MLFSQLPILRSNKMLLGRIMLHLSRIYLFFCSATCQICPSCRAKDAQAKRGKRPGHLSVPSHSPSLLLWLSPAPPAPPPAHCQPTYCSNALAIFVKFPGLGLGHLDIKANGQWQRQWRRSPVLRMWLQTRSSRLQDFGSRNSKRNLGKKICWQKPT